MPGPREIHVSRVLTAQAVRAKSKGPTQVLSWQWVQRATAGAARGPGPLLANGAAGLRLP